MPLLAGWLALCLLAFHAGSGELHRRRWSRWFFRGALRLAGIRLSSVGVLAPAPRLLLANHLSWLDVFALGGEAGSAFVAHDALAEQPVLRWLCQLNRTVFVARHQRAGVAGQIAQIGEALSRGETLTLFPEGGTGDGTALRPFKSSLLAAIEQAPGAAAVQPVWIDYGADAVAVAWFGEERGIANFLRILARPRGLRITVRFLAPLDGAERASRKTMAQAAQRRIEAELTARMNPQRVAL